MQHVKSAAYSWSMAISKVVAAKQLNRCRSKAVMSIYNNDPLNERGSASRIGPQIVNEDGEINIPKFITNEQNFIYFGEIICFYSLSALFVRGGSLNSATQQPIMPQKLYLI